MADFSDFLKSVECFRALDLQEIELLNEVCSLEVHEAGSVVIAEGTRKDNFYIIQDGSVSIYKRFRQPDCSLLAELGAGDLFGELSFIDDQPRSATVVTNVPSRLLAVHMADFKQLMESNLSISFAIMRSTARMIRIFNDNYVNTLKSRNRELEEMNARLEEYRDHLEEQVKVRTQELTRANEKLKKEIAFRRQTEAEKEKAIFRLESASMRMKTLSGLFPVCIKCRKIRDEEGYWQRFERYLQEHSDAEFRESICDDCSKALYPKYYK
jgi:CRP-like cAMP-binding protein